MHECGEVTLDCQAEELYGHGGYRCTYSYMVPSISVLPDV